MKKSKLFLWFDTRKIERSLRNIDKKYFSFLEKLKHSDTTCGFQMSTSKNIWQRCIAAVKNELGVQNAVTCAAVVDCVWHRPITEETRSNNQSALETRRSKERENAPKRTCHRPYDWPISARNSVKTAPITTIGQKTTVTIHYGILVKYYTNVGVLHAKRKLFLLWHFSNLRFS